MKNTWLIPTATLVLGAVGGFVAGHSPSTTTAATAESSSIRTRSASAGSLADDRGVTARHRVASDVQNTPGKMSQIQALIDHYASLKSSDFDAEARKLETMSFQDRMIAGYLLFSKWAESAPTDAMKYSSTMGFAGMFVRPTILQSWASVDPQNAAKYYTENPREFAMMGGPGGGPGGRGGNGASTIAEEWAKQDPEGALAWTKSLTGRDKGSAISSAIATIASTDPKKAADMLQTLDPSDRAQSYDSIARSWAAKDWSSASAWVQSLPADQQQAAMANAIRGLADQDPKSAAQKIASMQAGDSRDEAVSWVAESMSRNNPAEAAKWLLAQEGDKSGAMRTVIGNLARQDDSSALSLIGQQAAGDVKDSMIASYVRAGTSSDPQTTMQLAESITDQNERSRATGAAAWQWMQTNPDAAKAYIQQSTTLDDQTKQRLLDNRGGPRGMGGRGPRGGG